MRNPLLALATMFVASFVPANAQTSTRSSLRPVTSPVRDAGVYHLGLGTWTRHVDPTIAAVHEVAYANTCPTGYFIGQLQHEYAADEGRIPGPNGPVLCESGLQSTNRGCVCHYIVNGFQIGYCTGLPHSVDFGVGFQSAYAACAPPATTQSFTLNGLPGAAALAQGCWLVTIDLDASSQTFSLDGDGASCTWAPGDSPANHLFGWTFENLNAVTGVGSSYAGPLIASNGGPLAPPSGCSMVDGTRWDTLTCTNEGGGAAKWPNNLTEDGWGLSTQDLFRDDSTNGGPVSAPSGPGCYFFGSNPSASFHLRVYWGGGCGPEINPDFCRPVEDSLTCPCNNPPTTPGAGCNGLTGSTPTGGALMSQWGNAIPYDQPGGEAPSPAPHVSLTVTGLPTGASESSMLIQGPMSVPPSQFGQGLRCCGGPLKRMTPPHVAGGTTVWPSFGAPDFFGTISERSNNLPGAPVHILPGQTYCYFIEYRQSAFYAPCGLPSNFNASQATSIAWHL